jgi:selenocysteine lyase/cysteine desulfurase
VVGASYKWLLAPRGAAWLAISDEIRAELVPHHAGWFSGLDPWLSIYSLPWRPAPDEDLDRAATALGTSTAA